MKTIARFFVAKKRRRHKIIDKFARQKKYTHKNKYFGREREEKRELECMMLMWSVRESDDAEEQNWSRSHHPRRRE